MLRLGLPMAPSVLLQMVGPRVANHVLETMHDAYPERFPLSPTLASSPTGSDETRRASDDAALESRRSSPPRSRRWPTRSGTCSTRASSRRRRTSTPPAARRRLPVLPRRDHEAPRPDRHLGASVRAAARRGGARAFPPRDATTGASGSSSRRTRADASSTASASTSAPTRRSGWREELEARRLAVSRDGDTVFVYAEHEPEAEQARAASSRPTSREDGIEPPRSQVEHWLDEEDRWDDEPPQADVEEESSSAATRRGRCASRCRRTHEARRAGGRSSSSEGYGVVRRFRYLIVGTATRGRGPTRWHERVHGEAEPGGELVWEVDAAEPVRRLRRPRRLALPTPPEIGYARRRRSPTGDSRERALSLRLQHARAAVMQKTTDQPTHSAGGTDGLAAAAARAEAWAGEPFLHRTRIRRPCSRPGPPAGARSTRRSPRSRPGRASRRRVEGPLRPHARARARAERAAAAASPPARSCAATRSTRSPACSPS